jgi:hypothetical protein
VTSILGYPKKSESETDKVVKAVKAKRGQPDGFVGTGSNGYADPSQLGTGTASSGTFLRGDGSWAAGGGSGTVVTSGTATLDFGAFPGASETSIAITGQTGILAGSQVRAYITPAATADHSADEHRLEALEVFAGNIVAGTGFTIYLQYYKDEGDTFAYGTWNITWEWY